MPFSNINNSILMAQVNSLRRLCGLGGIAHGGMDLLAMISSPAAFLEVIGARLNAHTSRVDTTDFE